MKTDTYLLSDPNVTVRHEHDGKKHRIIIKERVLGKGNSQETEWYDHMQMIVILDERTPEYRRTSICATTEYWSTLPRVFRITTAEKL